MRGDERLPASVYRPVNDKRVLPAWVVLHGLTRTARAHPSLQKFASAVASAGNVVMVPEIPEWRDLRIEPAIAVATIHDAVRALQSRDDVRHEHVGLFGFSFGATQSLIAVADERTAGLLAGVAAWGGFCDLRRVFRFGLTGSHEIDGKTYETPPDPYGSWIMAGHYLPHVPGYEDMTSVAEELHGLAIEAGERRIYAWEPIFDESKRIRRARLKHDEHRKLFDLLAPETTKPKPDPERGLQLAEELADTALRMDPLLEPRPYLPHVRTPVLLAHGRDDRLIPFTETIRLSRELPPALVRSRTITALFQHSGGTASGLGPMGTATEGARFVSLLHRVLGLV